ncbi:sigma-54-dependent transcriptional regulator, partial [Candidatus Zixiibacteriota bacterium]
MTVNCAAMPSELIYSELFGHKKGAFTGASTDKEGKFGQANGGTIFLDEIGNITGEIQLALLRVLEYRKFSPLGSAGAEQGVDVRIICATHRRIDTIEGRGKSNFREDLFYRLNVLPIRIPPLREEWRDLLFLFLMFLKDDSEPANLINSVLPLGVIEDMLWYEWPGNIRELRNFSHYYREYCIVLRESIQKSRDWGRLFRFFCFNNALEEFLGDDQYARVFEQLNSKSLRLMYSGGLFPWNPVSFKTIKKILDSFLHVKPGVCVKPNYLQEKAIRQFFAGLSGNKELLNERMPIVKASEKTADCLMYGGMATDKETSDDEIDSGDTDKSIFDVSMNGDAADMPKFRDVVESYYRRLFEIYQSASNEALSKIA